MLRLTNKNYQACNRKFPPRTPPSVTPGCTRPHLYATGQGGSPHNDACTENFTFTLPETCTFARVWRQDTKAPHATEGDTSAKTPRHLCPTPLWKPWASTLTCFQVLFGSRVEEPSLAYLQNCLRDLEMVATIGAKGKADTKWRDEQGNCTGWFRRSVLRDVLTNRSSEALRRIPTPGSLPSCSLGN